MIDRMDVRRAVGEAVKRIERNNAAARAEIAAEKDRLHKRWRELQDQADAARKAVDRCSPKWRDREDIALLERLARENPDLRIMDREFTPHICPVVCEVTGLGIFKGDEVLGDPDYGACVLKAAVKATVEPVE